MKHLLLKAILKFCTNKKLFNLFFYPELDYFANSIIHYRKKIEKAMVLNSRNEGWRAK